MNVSRKKTVLTDVENNSLLKLCNFADNFNVQGITLHSILKKVEYIKEHNWTPLK